MVELWKQGKTGMKSGWWWKRVGMCAVTAGALALSGGLPSLAQAQDFEVTSGDERQQRIVERYMELVESNPAEERHLQSLLFHVGRGQGLNHLIDHYRRRVEARPESLNLHLVLGHLLRARGDFEDALAMYERAVELGPQASNAWLSRGQVRLMMGQRDGALTDFERALELEKNRQRRGEILQNLAELSFAQRDFERGIEFYKRRIALTPGDEYVRRDFASLLLQYRQWEEALAQYDALLRMVGGNTARRAEFLSERAEIFASMGQNDRALESLQQAIGLLRSDNWRVGEMRARMVDIYRQSGELGTFLERYARRWSKGGYDQQMLVADVYAETGQLDEALALYRRAAGRNRRAEEPRQKIIRIYERMGREQDLPAAYRDLMRAAPQRHGYGLELARHHMRMGQRDKALSVLRELERRFGEDSYVLLEIADHYGRWDMSDRAEATFERVNRLDPDDDVVILALAEHYFGRGERQRAVDTWRRLPDSRLGRVPGLARMGEVMVDRGLTDMGVSAYRQALSEAPEDMNVRRGLANALERARRWDEAAEAWNSVYERADREQLRQEARGRIVELYRRQQKLREQMNTWTRALEDQGDVRAGFFLAEAHLRLREFDRGAEVLEQLVGSSGVNDDEKVSALTLLERAYVQAERYDDAIVVLEQLVELRPQLAGELLARMSEYALRASGEAQAVDFAVRSLEVNPDDARAQARVAGIYEQAGEWEEAVRHYRAAAEIDPQAFDLRLALGRALLAQGRESEGEEVLWEVVRDATEDQMILEAGELLLNRAQRSGRLAVLEARWSPLAFRLPVRDAHGRLLLQLYSRMVGPLLVEAHHGDVEQRQLASAGLRDLGGRSASLLLDVVQSADVSQRARALRLIAELEVDLAVPMIARMIADRKEATRVGAIVAAARLADARLVGPLLDAASSAEPKVRQAAVWALGFMPAQRDLLRTLEAMAREESGGGGLALGSLARHGGKEAQRVIGERIEALAQGEPSYDAAQVFSALVESGRGEGEESAALVNLMKDASSPHAVWAARALGRRRSASGVSALWEHYVATLPVPSYAAEEGLRAAMRAGDRERDRATLWQDESRAFDWRRGELNVGALLAARKMQLEGGASLLGVLDNGIVAEALGRTLGRDAARWQKVAMHMLEEELDADVDGAGAAIGGRELATQMVAKMPPGVEGAAASLWRALAGDLNAQDVFGLAQEEQLDEVQTLLALRVAPWPSEFDRQGVSHWLRARLESEHAELRLLTLRVLAGLPGEVVQADVLKPAVLSQLDSAQSAHVIAAAGALAALNAVDALPRLRELEAEAPPAVRRALQEARQSLGAASPKSVEEETPNTRGS
ncbi:hypothetical protein DL240_00150 [Lujinxingia litoralis]|uniref:Uncharacterized protein n=1 Tax=Lujinxingia litoralis TaxID=2211119 RepID=A0A328CAK4_9DELT|nr:tetratricopeptide repeat protein [Lujinxingia litoralis]RAL24656.1 hypothetical protein DL240_00150 [Lujinxingia litoralis]